MSLVSKGTHLSLNRISCDLYRGLKLSESTPLFHRRILLAGHQKEEKKSDKACFIDKDPDWVDLFECIY